MKHEENCPNLPLEPRGQDTAAEVPHPRQPKTLGQEGTRTEVEDVEAERMRVKALHAWYRRARTDLEDFCGD